MPDDMPLWGEQISQNPNINFTKCKPLEKQPVSTQRWITSFLPDKYVHTNNTEHTQLIVEVTTIIKEEVITLRESGKHIKDLEWEREEESDVNLIVMYEILKLN